MRRIDVKGAHVVGRLDADTILLRTTPAADAPADDDALVYPQAPAPLFGVARGGHVVTIVRSAFAALTLHDAAVLAGEHLGARDTAPPVPSAAWPLSVLVRPPTPQRTVVDVFEPFALPPGVSIAELVERTGAGGRFPVGAALWIGEQLAHAVPLHAGRRPLRPSAPPMTNVRLGYDGSVVCPLATAMHEEFIDDGPGRIRGASGTFDDLDPEQLRGTLTAVESETYRVARLVWRLLLGRDPFSDGSVIGMFQRQMGRRAHPIGVVRDDVPADLVGFLEACLTTTPASRPGDASVCAAALQSFRRRFDDAGASIVAAMVAAHFGAERDNDLRVYEDAALVDVDAKADSVFGKVGPAAAAAPLAPLARRPEPVEVDGARRGVDGRMMILVTALNLWVDATLVSNGAWLLFTRATGRAPPLHWGGDVPVPGTEDLAVRGIAPEDADAFAAFCGKRLPSSDEYDVFAAHIGEGHARRPRHPLIDLLRVWEWTSDPAPGRHGRIVRGGRFRDQLDADIDVDNTSFDDDGALDIGFRCVEDDGVDGDALTPPDGTRR